MTEFDYMGEPPAFFARSYLPLKHDEFRLLVLHPGQNDDPLHACLETALLSKVGDYEAISYVWGKSMPDKSIYLPSGPFGITSSLYLALRDFRHETKSRRLWADAICINQSDLAERSEQVTKMDRIYSHANSVLIWLGEASLTGALALWTAGVLHETSKLPEMQMDAFRRFTRPGMVVRNRLDAYFANKVDQFRYKFNCLCCSDCAWAPTPSLQGAMDAMSELWRNHWFYRLWVVQEAALGRQCYFYYGRYGANFEHVSSACDMWNALFLPPETESLVAATPLWMHVHISGMIRTVQHWRKSSYSSDLQHFLDTSEFALTSLGCSKTQDLLFGLKALPFLSAQPSLKPDYDLSLPELWRRLAIVIITSAVDSTTSPAVILAMAGAESKPRLSWRPSWVPMVHAYNEACSRIFGFYSNESLYHFAGGSRSLFRPWTSGNEKNVLCARGFRFSQICSLDRSSVPPSTCDVWNRTFRGEGWGDSTATEELIQWYLRCLGFATQTGLAYADGYLKDTFATLLVQGRSFRSDNGKGVVLKRRPSRDGKRPIHHLWDSALRTYVFQNWSKLYGNDACESALQTVRQHLKYHLQPDGFHHYIEASRVLASTSNGYVGWVPAKARKGDEVWLLEGAPFPFVLRPNGQACRLVGDAYIHGIAKGEAWPESDRDVQLVRLS